MSTSPDAVVVGSGPNGLAAAITLAQAGLRTLLREAQPTLGGGLRSSELTLPGFVHDVCSAVHPLALSSPFFRSLPLAQFGLEWIQPDAPLTHPLDGGAAAVLEQSMDAMVRGLGDGGASWRRMHGAFARGWDGLSVDVLTSPLHVPTKPVLMAHFGALALLPATLVARGLRGTPARALFAGNAAHSFLALEAPGTAAFGLLLGAAGHAVGWPIARGGSQRFADALVAYFRSLGGEVQTDAPLASLDELGGARVVMLDLGPHQFARIGGSRLPARYRRALERYRYGAAAFKVDWALDGPVPWDSPACARSATVHLGGTLEEIAQSERDVWSGKVSERPYVLLAQPSLFDPTRAPEGKHTAWAYCHVPPASSADMLPAIERQIERFAPGFRERVIARHVMTPSDFERMNPNLVGGDIAAGITDLRQFVARPTLRWYSTPASGIYICSASTPPGVGVHGMCGYHAAQRALKDLGLDVSGAPRPAPGQG
jgi:phytoene dehydrogenase-like protein